MIEKTKRAGLTGLILAALITAVGCQGKLIKERVVEIFPTDAGTIQEIAEEWDGGTYDRLDFMTKEGKRVATFSDSYERATVKLNTGQYYTYSNENNRGVDYVKTAKFPEHKKSTTRRVLETEIGTLSIIKDESDVDIDYTVCLESKGEIIAEFTYDSMFSNATVSLTNGKTYVREENAEEIKCSAEVPKTNKDAKQAQQTKQETSQSKTEEVKQEGK